MGCWWTEKHWGRMAFRWHHDQTFTIKATGTNQVLLSLFSSLCPTIVSPLLSGFSLSRLAKTSALSRTFHRGHLLKYLSRFCGSHPLSSWTGWDAGLARCVTHSRRLSTLLIRHRVQVAVKHYTHTSWAQINPKNHLNREKVLQSDEEIWPMSHIGIISYFASMVCWFINYELPVWRHGYRVQNLSND